MLYVEGLRTIHSTAYDWGARKIHPLLQAAEAQHGTRLLTRDAGDARGWRLNGGLLRSLLEANVAFCLKGDEAPWHAAIGSGPAAAAAWAAFKRKYAPFFVADYE